MTFALHERWGDGGEAIQAGADPLDLEDAN
jgi:hypothetical protein